MRIIILVIASCLIQACTNEVTKSEGGYKTPYGIIEEEAKDTDNYEYRFSIRLDGNDIYRQQYGVVGIKNVFVINQVAFVVISFGEGAIACPDFFRVIEIRAKDKIFVSDEFGPCSDTAEITESSGAISIKMPDYIPHPDLLDEVDRKQRENTTYEYRYQNGEILVIKHSIKGKTAKD